MSDASANRKDLRGAPSRVRARRRDEALALRAAGCSVNDIAEQVGVARSTAYRWVGHLPLDGDAEAVRKRRRAHSKAMTDARWAAHRLARDSARRETIAATAAWVRRLHERELILVGAAIYWCEGGKTKPWRPHDYRVKFINSDPDLVRIFLRFLAALGVPRARLRFRVSIHETADAASAVRWWADVVGARPEDFQPTVLKRHRPETVRKNVGDGYHGCLTIDVLQSSQVYWKIEGIMAGMSGEVSGPER